MSVKTITRSIALVLGLCGTAQASPIVINGGFEDLGGQPLNGGNYGFYEAIPGWTVAPNMPLLEIQTAPTTRSIDPKFGLQYAELDSTDNTTILQDIFLGAGSHVLRFFYAPRMYQSTANTNDLSFAIGDLFTGLISGGASPEYPGGVWTEVRTGFKVRSAGSYTLRFSAEGRSNGQGALIDGVSISEVPLPASGLLLLAGLGGLAAWRRRG